MAHTQEYAMSLMPEGTVYQDPANKLNRKSLRDILKLLEADYNVSFNFDDDVVKGVTLPSAFTWRQKEKLEKVLKRLLPIVNLEFEKLDNANYLIFSIRKTKSVSIRNNENPHQQHYTATVKSVIDSAAIEGEYTISGNVKDETGSALAGVNVIIKGSTSGTATDAFGRYTIKVPKGYHTLHFSYIGYHNHEAVIQGNSINDVFLVPNIQSLAEVVVVAYGEVKKNDVTGSVSTIPVEEIRKVVATSFDQSIQGRAAGMQVTQNSASPGGTTTIRIRGGNSIQGDNEPLYVVDGIPFKNDGATSGAAFNILSTLNSSDVESITILKDASSTALYGSRGANGVVIITTKRGKSGKPTVNFESFYGLQRVRRKYPVLNAMEYATMVNDVNIQEGKPAVYTQDQINAFGTGTDWQDEIFRTAPMANYQLSMTGGDERTHYALSGGYFTQDGVVTNTGFDRTSFRVNLDRKLSERMKIGNSLTVSMAIHDQSRMDGDLGNAGMVTMAALQYPPILPVKNPDGTFLMTSPALNFTADNPVALAEDSKNKNTAFRTLGNVFGDVKIIDALTLRVTLGIDAILLKNDNYLPRSVQSGLAQGGLASIFNSQAVTWLNENILTYYKTIRDIHRFNFLVGYTQQSNRTEQSRVASRNFVNDALGTSNIGSGSVALTPYSEVGLWGLNSYLARVNYSYDEKYLVTASLRADGSSRFGSNNRYAYFHSIALGWKLKEESFLKDIRALSDLKLRATYGTTGNQDGIGNYPSIALLGKQNYSSGNSVTTGIGLSQIANPDLTWETTSQGDIGIDADFLNSRITLTADVYIKRTKDLLLNVTLPVTSGYTSALRNLGRVENKGLELSLSTHNAVGAFQWLTNVNVAMNKNTVLDIGSVPQLYAGQVANIAQHVNSGIIRVGEPLGSFYGYVTDGLYQTTEELTTLVDANAKNPGDRKYSDLTPDGVINDLDRTIIGRAQPQFFGGVTNTFFYKRFELSVFFQGVFGNDILNANRFELEYLNGTNNLDRDMLKRWTPTHTHTDIPRASSTRPANRISDRQIEDGSYLRLKNVQLAYNLPTTFTQKLKIESVRVFVTAQNFLTLTHYTGFDPEVNRFGQDNRSQGFDYASYPAAKALVAGIHVGF
jgi:TonB-linked SusC/RagA family outer membrane protein